MAGYSNNSKSALLSSGILVQAPFIKVQIGQYTFGVWSKRDANIKDDDGFYLTNFNVMYPNYIRSLTINKINGQVNQYTLSMIYPVTINDDPNFLEKVFSSVSNTRKIIFSYGDMNLPSYIYKDEEALITKVQTGFDLRSGTIQYTISATSTAILNTMTSKTRKGGMIQPSVEIVNTLKQDAKLSALFSGMNRSNYDTLIEHTDKVVHVETKTNMNSLDWINYLVSCMVPAETTNDSSADAEVYALVIHDDTTYDKLYNSRLDIKGAYFTVEKISHKKEHSDALEIDIGFGNSTMLVSSFTLENQENYSLLYEYASDGENEYVERIDNDGQVYHAWAPQVSSRNNKFETRAEDLVWYTKMTKYPVKATIVVNGLIRSVNLMTYIRLNVIYPGGQRHVSSGLYLITKQTDNISEQGYKTTLNLTRIGGDE